MAATLAIAFVAAMLCHESHAAEAYANGAGIGTQRSIE